MYVHFEPTTSRPPAETVQCCQLAEKSARLTKMNGIAEWKRESPLSLSFYFNTIVIQPPPPHSTLLASKQGEEICTLIGTLKVLSSEMDPAEIRLIR